MVQAWGIIFVVDACSQDRIPEAKEALNEVFEHDKMKGKPLLIFANKQDGDDAISEGLLGDQLDLSGILGEHKRLSRVVCPKMASFSIRLSQRDSPTFLSNSKDGIVGSL